MQINIESVRDDFGCYFFASGDFDEKGNHSFCASADDIAMVFEMALEAWGLWFAERKNEMPVVDEEWPDEI